MMFPLQYSRQPYSSSSSRSRGLKTSINRSSDHLCNRQTFRRWCHIEVACPNYWFLLVEIP